MKNRQIRKIKRNIRHGNRRFILRQLATSKERVKADLSRLDEALRESARQHAEQKATWTGELANPHMRPIELSDQMRSMKIAFVGALIALGFEVLIAGSQTNWSLVVVAVALLAPMVMKAGLLSMLYDENQPQETVRKIKTWIVKPSVGLSFGSLILILLARTIPAAVGPLKALFSGAVLAFVVSITFIAIGLFALANIYGWSKETAEQFHVLEAELINTRELYRYILSREAELMPPPPPLRTNHPQQKAGELLPIPKAALWLLAACTPLFSEYCYSRPRTLEAAPDNAAACRQNIESADKVSADSPTELVVMLDRSNSQTAASWRAAYDELMDELPALCEQYNVIRLVIYGFTNNGWAGEPVATLALPEFIAPEPVEIKKSEIEIFLGSADQATAQQKCLEEAQKLTAARNAYRQQLVMRLAKLTEVSHSEPFRHDREPLQITNCTDLNGALARITRLDTRRHRQLVLLLTDGEESCQRQLRAVARPQGDLALGIVLTTSHAGQAAHEQFEMHRRLLSSLIPWAAIGSFNDQAAYERTLAEAVMILRPPKPNIGVTATTSKS